MRYWDKILKSIIRNFRKQVLNYASFLSGSGIRSEEYIPILSDNNKEFIYLVLALWTIGAVPVPLNTRLTQNEINKLLAITGSKYVIIQNDISKNYQFDNSVTQIIFPFELSNLDKTQIQKINFDKDKTAVVIFTSGSTGTPKGVELSFNNLFKNAEIGDQVLGQGNNQRWLASLPFYHIGGFSIITRTLHYGASLIIPGSLKIDDLAFAIKNQKPTFVSFVSTQLNRLIENNIKPNSELKTVLLGGGFIDSKLVEKALEQGWKITKVYGSSETSSFVTANKIENLQSKLDSVGKALSPNEIKIVDSDGKSLPQNSSGEIVVKSEAVMKGYLNNSEETSSKLKNGYYFTGDIGHIDEEGFLFIEARRSDLIISGGENVNPVEVEKEILKYNGISDCAVIGIPDKTWGHIVAAAIVTNDKNMNVENLKEFLSKSLAGFKIPKIIKELESLPKTSTRKN